MRNDFKNRTKDWFSMNIKMQTQNWQLGMEKVRNDVANKQKMKEKSEAIHL